MLKLRNKKPDFKKLFNDYLERYTELENEYYNNLFFNYYDDDYDDYYNGDYYFGTTKSKKNLFKYNKSKNKSKSNFVSLGLNNRYSSKKKNRYNRNDDDKLIYYYSDIDSPSGNTKVFYSVYDFDKFLDEEGIFVSDDEIDNLLSRDVSHCCIDPKSYESGRLSLITDTSYGNLRWECALSNDELTVTK